MTRTIVHPVGEELTEAREAVGFPVLTKIRGLGLVRIDGPAYIGELLDAWGYPPADYLLEATTTISGTTFMNSRDRITSHATWQSDYALRRRDDALLATLHTIANHLE